VIYKRVVAVVISIWVLSIFASFSMLWVPLDHQDLAVRRHKNQIQALQVQQQAQAGEISNFASLINSAVGNFHVYLMFLICYVSYFISLAVFKINGPNVTLKNSFLFH